VPIPAIGEAQRGVPRGHQLVDLVAIPRWIPKFTYHSHALAEPAAFALIRRSAMEQRKTISATPAYQQGDPAAVTAYYRIHFKPAFADPQNYEKFMTRLSASFTKDGVVKARAVEARLMTETWSKPDYNLLPKLKTLTIPTLIISGDHEFIPPAAADHIAQSLPNARLVTLKDCGHFTYMECPAAVRENIDAFFKTK
jgi:proline iminopeptidase